MLFEHRNGQRQRKHLRADDGELDAVNAEQGSQDKHRSGFKHQSAHREDSGQREAQQLAVAEMVGEGDGGYGGFELGCENTIILKNTSILTPYLYLRRFK